jgi:hypothetical protein
VVCDSMIGFPLTATWGNRVRSLADRSVCDCGLRSVLYGPDVWHHTTLDSKSPDSITLGTCDI